MPFPIVDVSDSLIQDKGILTPMMFLACVEVGGPACSAMLRTHGARTRLRNVADAYTDGSTSRAGGARWLIEAASRGNESFCGNEFFSHHIMRKAAWLGWSPSSFPPFKL